MNDTCRILAKNEYRSNNTWETGINNNDLIIGPSGAGKTRYYVKPNMLQCNESMIVADTKGNLQREIGPVLTKKGYEAMTIDFTSLADSYGYNPMDSIRYDPETDSYNQQDIMTIAECMVPLETYKDPFWDYAARQYLACMISYVLDCLPLNEHHPESLCILLQEMAPKKMRTRDSVISLPCNFERLMDEYEKLMPESGGVRKHNMYKATTQADKMHASILGILSEKLDVFSFDDAINMFKNPRKIRFEDLSKRKTVLFLNMSDTDRSLDKLANLFYTQCLQVLCRHADISENSRLQIPVRLILDDFATNVMIPDFDKIISVIRSREIYTSVILQSLSQLEAVYGRSKAMTIINNCDNMLYLGGQDVETARYFATKLNRTESTILNLPLNKAFLFTRGSEPKEVERYELKEHPLYPELPEAYERKEKHEHEK